MESSSYLGSSSDVPSRIRDIITKTISDGGSSLEDTGALMEENAQLQSELNRSMDRLASIRADNGALYGMSRQSSTGKVNTYTSVG